MVGKILNHTTACGDDNISVLPGTSGKLRSRSLLAVARPSVVCCLSVVCLSVTLVRRTQAVQIFGNISTALGTLAIH